VEEKEVRKRIGRKLRRGGAEDEKMRQVEKEEN